MVLIELNIAGRRITWQLADCRRPLRRRNPPVLPWRSSRAA